MVLDSYFVCQGLLIQRDTSPDPSNLYSNQMPHDMDDSVSMAADPLSTSHGGGDISNLWAAQNEQSMFNPANMSNLSMAGSVFSHGASACR